MIANTLNVECPWIVMLCARYAIEADMNLIVSRFSTSISPGLAFQNCPSTSSAEHAIRVKQNCWSHLLFPAFSSGVVDLSFHSVRPCTNSLYVRLGMACTPIACCGICCLACTMSVLIQHACHLHCLKRVSCLSRAAHRPVWFHPAVSYSAWLLTCSPGCSTMLPCDSSGSCQRAYPSILLLAPLLQMILPDASGAAPIERRQCGASTPRCPELTRALAAAAAERGRPLAPIGPTGTSPTLG